MEKRLKGKDKIIPIFLFSVLIILLLISTSSAGWFEDLRKAITGGAAEPITVNISIGKPEIRNVYNSTASIINSLGSFNQGPLPTYVELNFSAYLSAGVKNLNDSTAGVNFTIPGAVRQNTSCAQIAAERQTNILNYTCNVTMWWWDNSTTWSINAFVKDNTTNIGTNSSTNVSVASTTGFEMGPTNLTWPGISPGAENQTSNNDPMTINNTGNQIVGTGSILNLSVNATDLEGETTSTDVIYARNFSVGLSTGGVDCVGAACTECGGSGSTTIGSGSNYTNITASLLPAENYTKNDGTAQEELYFCIRIIGSELSNQQYSTVSKGVWYVQVA